MKRNRNPEKTQRSIIEATHRILREGGYFTNFSLAKVAKTADISKGGLMHHFPSKADLVRAAARDAIERFELRFKKNLEGEGDVNGRYTRAYAKTAINSAEFMGEMSPLLLAHLHDDETDETRFAAWQKQLDEDGIDPVTAAIVRLTADGIIYTELIDDEAIDEDLKEKILARLLEMVGEN